MRRAIIHWTILWAILFAASAPHPDGAAGDRPIEFSQEAYAQAIVARQRPLTPAELQVIGHDWVARFTYLRAALDSARSGGPPYLLLPPASRPNPVNQAMSYLLERVQAQGEPDEAWLEAAWGPHGIYLTDALHIYRLEHDPVVVRLVREDGFGGGSGMKLAYLRAIAHEPGTPAALVDYWVSRYPSVAWGWMRLTELGEPVLAQLHRRVRALPRGREYSYESPEGRLLQVAAKVFAMLGDRRAHDVPLERVTGRGAQDARYYLYDRRFNIPGAPDLTATLAYQMLAHTFVWFHPPHRPPQTRPVPDAGPDRVVLAAGVPCRTVVELDASGSSDPKGRALGFKWIGVSERSNERRVTFTLGAGVHPFELWAYQAEYGEPAGYQVSSSMDFDNVWITVNCALPPAADSCLSRGRPGANYGAGERLILQEHSRPVLAFDLSRIPLRDLAQARLVLTLAEPLGGEQDDRHEHEDREHHEDPHAHGAGDEAGWRVEARALRTAFDEERVTWACPSDADLSNARPDCDAPWDGGATEAPTAPPVRILPGQQGRIEWDVTSDLFSGHHVGWQLRLVDDDDEHSHPGADDDERDRDGHGGRDGHQDEHDRGEHDRGEHELDDLLLLHAREGAAAQGDRDLAPVLILEYGRPRRGR